MHGFNVPSSHVSYALASNNGGQSFAPNVWDNLVFDTVTHVGNVFNVAVGDYLISFPAGIYIAFGGLYTPADPMATGVLTCFVNSTASGFAPSMPLLASLTSLGGANSMKFCIAPTGGTVWAAGIQSDSGAVSLAGDLLVIRLGDV